MAASRGRPMVRRMAAKTGELKMTEYNWADDDARELAAALDHCKWCEGEIDRLTAERDRLRTALVQIVHTAPWSDYEGHKECLEIARRAGSEEK